MSDDRWDEDPYRYGAGRSRYSYQRDSFARDEHAVLELLAETGEAPLGAGQSVTGQRLFQLTTDFRTVRGVIDLFLATGEDTIPVLVTADPVETYPIIDIFNPRALEIAQAPTDNPAADGLSRGWLRTVEWNRDLVQKQPAEKVVSGFFELFKRTLAVIKRSPSQVVNVGYEVRSVGSGYQVEYYPQYNFSPRVFGSALSTPVKGNIPIGNYHFQGWLGGNVTRDGGVYEASLVSNIAHLRDF